MTTHLDGSVRRTGSSVVYINEDNPTHIGESIIFINGIYNKEHDAILSAKQTSSLVGSGRVVLFYNPTLSLVGEVLSTQELSIRCSRLILDENARCQREVQQNPGAQIRLLILAHSHGATLAAKTIARPEIQAIKNHIEIATFGGAQLIDNLSCRRVQNFINETDLISIGAQTELGSVDSSGLVGFIWQFQQLAYDQLLETSAHRNPELSQRIGIALKIHQKLRQNYDPTSAKAESYAEMMTHTLQEETQVDRSRLIEEFVRLFLIECKYNIEISHPTHSIGIGHSVDTYYPKITEVINGVQV